MSAAVVTVVSLGGTISMTSVGGAGVEPTLDAADLIRGADMPADVRVTTNAFRKIPGGHLTFEDVEALATLIESLTEDGGAVVVTQGTDTLEEVAFAIDLLVPPERRVIFTGAMRPPNAAGSDGPGNLEASVAVAASGALLGGVVVVMADEVHAARLVAKRHATKTGAFSSPGMGPIGTVVEGRTLLHGRASRLGIAPIARRPRPRPARVPIVRLGLGDEGFLLRQWSGADGLVVECYGGGHAPAWLLEDLAGAAAAIPVVMVSRTGEGAVLRDTYGFTGSEIDLHRAGLLTAGTLDGLKARVLLTLLLRHGSPREARRAFDLLP